MTEPIRRLRAVLEWMEAAHDGANYAGYLEELEDGSAAWNDVLQRVEKQLHAWKSIEYNRGNKRKAGEIRQKIDALTPLYT